MKGLQVLTDEDHTAHDSERDRSSARVCLFIYTCSSNGTTWISSHFIFYWQDAHDHNIFYDFQINWRLIHSWKGLCSCFALLINSIRSLVLRLFILLFSNSLLLFCVVLCVRLIAANDALINQELVCTKFDCLLHSSWLPTHKRAQHIREKSPKKNQKISVWWGRNEIAWRKSSLFLLCFNSKFINVFLRELIRTIIK